MAENKTKPTGQSVEEFLDKIEDPTRREDCKNIAGILEELAGAAPKMWGESIVGFGDYHYKLCERQGRRLVPCRFFTSKTISDPLCDRIS